MAVSVYLYLRLLAWAMFEMLRELYAYKSMVYNLVRRDLRGRYKGSLLGMLWNFILPLMQIIVYVMVFSIIFRQNIEHYYVYLIVGMIPWILFSDSISCGSGSVVENSSLVTKIYFPRSVIPVSIVISKLVNFFISLVFVFAVLIICGHGIDIVSLSALPLAIVCILMFTLGLTLVLAAANVFMRDIQYLITVLLMMWIWLTPIMYVQDFVDSDFMQYLLNINPLTYLISLFQDSLYWKVFPDFSTIGICVVESVLMLVIGLAVYNKYSSDFAEVL